MKVSPIKKDFLKTLYRVSLASFFIKLVAVPAGLVQAQLTSDVVISATKGDFYGVLKKGGLIILLIFLVKIFEFVTQVAYQEAKSNAIHKCKLDLYKQYFSSPLSLLYSSSAGQAAVIFQNDFNTLTNMITEVGPGTISAFTMVVAYASFICVQSPLVACILVGVSLAQIIPPLIFKRLYIGSLSAVLRPPFYCIIFPTVSDTPPAVFSMFPIPPRSISYSPRCRTVLRPPQW